MSQQTNHGLIQGCVVSRVCMGGAKAMKSETYFTYWVGGVPLTPPGRIYAILIEDIGTLH